MTIIFKLTVKVTYNETDIKGLNHKVTTKMICLQSQLEKTDDERRKLTHIPDNVETRDVLENLLFDLSLKGLLTDDNLNVIIHNR
jgi:hypothetical protein